MGVSLRRWGRARERRLQRRAMEEAGRRWNIVTEGDEHIMTLSFVWEWCCAFVRTNSEIGPNVHQIRLKFPC